MRYFIVKITLLLKVPLEVVDPISIWWPLLTTTFIEHVNVDISTYRSKTRRRNLKYSYWLHDLTEFLYLFYISKILRALLCFLSYSWGGRGSWSSSLNMKCKECKCSEAQKCNVSGYINLYKESCLHFLMHFKPLNITFASFFRVCLSILSFSQGTNKERIKIE